MAEVSTIGHPMWCDRDHARAFPMHRARTPEFEIGNGISLEVNMTDYSHGLGPVVELVAHEAGDTTILTLQPEQADCLEFKLRELREMRQ